MPNTPGREGGDLLKLMAERKERLSKGHRLIADFILSNYGKAAYMTAAGIGEAVGVSESTVVRFALEIGFEGFPKFQKSLRELIKARLTSLERMEVSDGRISEENVVRAVMQSDMEKLKITMEEFDHDAFNRALESLLSAHRVYILGVRSSAPLAGFLGFYFNLVFDNIRLVHTTSVSEMFEQIIQAGPDDVVVGITFPRYSTRTVKAMQFVRSQGARVIAITDNPESAPAQAADIALIARSDMVSFVDSLVAPLSVINALIVAVALRRREHLTRTLHRLEKIWDEYNVYERMDGKDQEERENRDY